MADLTSPQTQRDKGEAVVGVTIHTAVKINSMINILLESTVHEKSSLNFSVQNRELLGERDPTQIGS